MNEMKTVPDIVNWLEAQGVPVKQVTPMDAITIRIEFSDRDRAILHRLVEALERQAIEF